MIKKTLSSVGICALLFSIQAKPSKHTNTPKSEVYYIKQARCASWAWALGYRDVSKEHMRVARKRLSGDVIIYQGGLAEGIASVHALYQKIPFNDMVSLLYKDTCSKLGSTEI